MEPVTDNKDFWTRVLPKMSWSLRDEHLPKGRLLLKRETLEKLNTLITDYAGEDDPKMLEHLVTGHRTNGYVTALINSMYAFRHLAPSKRSEMPLCDLSSAFRGLLPKCDRYHAVDFSEPERYEASRPFLEAVTGILKTGGMLIASEFLIRDIDGTLMLTPEMKEIVANHPDKAEAIPVLLRARNFDSTNIKEIGDLLDNAATPLLEGTL